MFCNKRCFANNNRPGTCAALSDKCEDNNGRCKFHKLQRDELKEYVSVKMLNGKRYFKEKKTKVEEAAANG